MIAFGSWQSRFLAGALAVAVASPLAAATLQQQVEARLAEAGPGVRFGIVVADDAGRELVAINPEDRFIPASNTKLFTTAAAFARLAVDLPDGDGGALVRLEEGSYRVPDAILEGRGDARLSSAADCIADCLATLADAVAARTRAVGDVVGDDSLFPDERWSPGMSWNNIPTRSGTAASALSLDDNELRLRVAPSAPGREPTVEGLPYYRVVNRALTVAPGVPAELGFDRLPGSDVLRISGTVAAGSEPQILRVGIDDPAHYAAWRFKALLMARGVRVAGTVAVRHRPPGPADDPAVRGAAPPPRPPLADGLARLTPPPLAEDLVLINKSSHNLHAELLLRRLGRRHGTGSVADGIAAVRAVLGEAGVPRTAVDLSDGSGMSTYNRAAPRGVVSFLRWASGQPWGAAWRATLPVAGVDGTLARRFRGTPLEGRLFAKTGSLNATSALSGYMVARSGRVLTFSAFANDIPEGAPASSAIDAALALIAQSN
jgi:D-alanyl-D-alanine carboxypeptidase/D-alanyl-D-alanine-endopeptidase (penicillin-binding protein 4)